MASATWLSSSGRVWWRRKAQWVLQCPMNFRWMPFDEHRLFARVSSWQYPPEQLKITLGSPGSDGQLSKSLAVIDDECRAQNSEWTVLDMDHFETEEAGGEPSNGPKPKPTPMPKPKPTPKPKPKPKPKPNSNPSPIPIPIPIPN